MRKGYLFLFLVLPIVLAHAQQAPLPLSAHLSLPPKEYVRPGATITGRIIVDEPAQQKPSPEAISAAFRGAVVEAGGQRVPVDAKGLFVFRMLENAQHVWLRVQTPAAGAGRGMYFLPEVNDEVVVGFSGKTPTVTPVPTATAQGAFRCQAPPTAHAGPPYIVKGNLPGGGNGLATTARFDQQEAPLLWKADDAAAFDTSSLQPGPQIFSLYENSQLVAAGGAHVVRLTATTDRATLRRKEVATFTTTVEGLPGDWIAQREAQARAAGRTGDAGAVAFLDYVNHTPNIGHVQDKPDEFSIPVLHQKMLAAAITPGGRETLDLLLAFARLLYSDHEWPDPKTTAQRRLPKTFATSYSFTDTRHYRGERPGTFHVQVTLRLPDSATQPRPLATPKEWSAATPQLLIPLTSDEDFGRSLLDFFPPSSRQPEKPLMASAAPPQAPGGCTGSGTAPCGPNPQGRSVCQSDCERSCGGSPDPDCASRCTARCSLDCHHPACRALRQPARMLAAATVIQPARTRVMPTVCLLAGANAPPDAKSPACRALPRPALDAQNPPRRPAQSYPEQGNRPSWN